MSVNIDKLLESEKQLKSELKIIKNQINEFQGKCPHNFVKTLSREKDTFELRYYNHVQCTKCYKTWYER